ncbi:DUF11 domain-containing protein [Sphingomonas immobilis]|uniref:DUF11 domain-containing protein n=1 Tax=Sphingomonas immobilis TaxID=3063997 RepID=A0ABT8ZUQ9_9SPHN|nr:DUF11 domain-containing protein [Sphingomonas sp. CA1-15]MDO7841316.1 DUF11 domain-containing protein [Sphingomonas sp. CA1-15]
MILKRAFLPLAALVGLATVVPATAQESTRVANTATLSFDGSNGRSTISSNTVALDVDRAKLPTRLSARLLPVGYELTGMKCVPNVSFTPAPIDAETLAQAPMVDSVDSLTPLIWVLESVGSNRDPNVRETASIDVTSNLGAVGKLLLLETGPNTGVFAGGVPQLQGGSDDPAIAACNPLNDREITSIKLSFTEDDYSYASDFSLLIDPAGYVFDSSTGALVDGAIVTLLDANDQPAAVYGDDGVSRYPSTVVSGAGVTDASGRVYDFPQGNFRFPLVAPGSYHLKVVPPGNYTAPSIKTPDELAKLRDPKNTPFLINDASYGRPFTLATVDPFYTDIPLDRQGSTQLLLTKVASVREASPGDFVQYKVTIANRGTAPATNIHLTDILPTGLRYEIGSARGAPEPVVSKDGRTLDFAAPTVAAGAAQDVTYVVSITPGAPVGEALNRVLASGTGGATSNEAAASVRITSLLFTDGFTLIGRVTEGDCGDPNRGRKGIAGIRLLLEDGTFVVTDKDGYYHVEGVRPGRHVVQIDTGSISPAFEPVACDSDTRTAGSSISRFVEGVGGILKRVDFQLRPTGRKLGAADALPIAVASAKDAAGDRDWFANQVPGAELLFPTPDYNPRAPVTRVIVKHAAGQHVALFVNGTAVDPINFDTIEMNDDKSIALSRWTGIALNDGDNTLEARVINADGSVAKVLTRTIHSSGAGVNAVFAPAASRLIADGLTRPLIAVRVTDRTGRPVRDGTLVPFKVDQPYGAAIDAELAQGNQIAGRDKAQTIARVTGDDGLAFIALQPTTQAGNVHVVVSLADDKQVRTSDIRAWLQGSAKDWIVVGFGAGTIGYDTLTSRTKTLPNDMKGGVFTDGQIAFYAKGRIKGSWLATIAYDSDRKIDRSRGLLGTIDPDRYYTVYGDGSRQGYDAPTSQKLYLRLERRNFYALFGDFETGLTEGQLTRYSRTLNGVKTEFDNGRVTFTGFAANTDQLYGRDEIQGNGLSGPYRLSGRDIVPNSDKIRLETRDRLRPEQIKATTLLTRHLDYDIDPVAGTLRFRQPVLGRDADLNPVFIVADYETYGSTKHLVTGGRATVKLAKGKVQLGASVLHDESAGNATVAGADIRAKVTRNTEVRAEFATGGRLGLSSGQAWLAEVEHHDRKLDLLAYGRSQDTAFGLGQQNVVEAGTRKFGIDGRYAITEKLSVTATAWHSQQLDGPGMRDAADVRLEYRRPTGTFFVGGQFANDTGVDGGGRQSRLLTVGGSQYFFKGKLEISGQAQVAPGGDKASVDFPTRQQINAALKITDGIRLLGGYEIAGGKDYTVGTARVGFDVSPWKGAKLMSTLNQQDIGENGQRTYAQYGLNQSFAISKAWSADVTLDASQTLRGSIPTGGFVTAFQSTAQGSTAGQYQNDGDYVAVTGGLGYRANKWAWNGRLEYRRSDASTRWGITTDVLRSLGQGRTLAGSFKYYDLTDKKGARASTMNADLALAWRPADSRWSVLDRLQFRNDSADAGFTDTNVLGVPAYGNGFQATLRFINNLAVNYRTGDEGRGHGFEATVYYGSKWVKGSFGSDDYEGYIDATGFELRKDIGPKIDIGIQGSVQHAWERGIWAFSGGPNIGISPAKNLWLSAGYNVSGYRDRDFEDDRYTRQGPYVTLRMKFDQLSVKGFGRNVLGIGR